MYADKIFSMKFLPRRGTYLMKPLITTFDAHLYYRVGEESTVVSAPPGREDYILLDYHEVISSIYDAALTIDSISLNDIGVEERYYNHRKFEKPKSIEVNIDLSRRLRKFEYVFDMFFDNYLLALERLRESIRDELWKYGNAYLVSKPTERRLDDRLLVRLWSPLDRLAFLDIVVSDNRVRARVGGPPINALCYLSFLKTCDIKHMLKYAFKKQDFDRVWKRRAYYHELRVFTPVVVDYIRRLNVECDLQSFARVKHVPIHVYAFDVVYSREYYFNRIMEKKNMFLS